MKHREPDAPLGRDAQEDDRESQALLAILALSAKSIKEGKTAPASEVFARIRRRARA